MKTATKWALCLGLSANLIGAAALAEDDKTKADEKPTTAEKAKEEVSKITEDVRTKTYEITDKDVLEVDFNKGSAQLSEADRNKLRAMVKAAREKGKIDKVVVATYADKEFKPTAQYTDADKSLAEQRADNLEKVLDELGADSVDVYNMAEKPNWFEKNLKMDDAQVKGEATNQPVTKDAKKDAEDKQLAAIGERLQKEGGPSKAVIILQPQTVAH